MPPSSRAILWPTATADCFFVLPIPRLGSFGCRRSGTGGNAQNPSQPDGDQRAGLRRGEVGGAGAGGGAGLVGYDAGVPGGGVLASGAGGPVAGRHGVLPLLARCRAVPPGALRFSRPRARVRGVNPRRRGGGVVDARLPAPRRRHAPLRRHARRGGASRSPRQALLR